MLYKEGWTGLFEWQSRVQLIFSSAMALFHFLALFRAGRRGLRPTAHPIRRSILVGMISAAFFLLLQELPWDKMLPLKSNVSGIAFAIGICFVSSYLPAALSLGYFADMHQPADDRR